MSYASGIVTAHGRRRHLIFMCARPRVFPRNGYYTKAAGDCKPAIGELDSPHPGDAVKQGRRRAAIRFRYSETPGGKAPLWHPLQGSNLQPSAPEADALFN